MKSNATNRGPKVGKKLKTLKALGLLGIVGMAGATLLIAPLAGSGCSDNTGGAGGNSGVGGTVGTGGATGAGGSTAMGGRTGSDGGTDTVGPAPASASALQISIQNFMYAPNTLIVPAGAQVQVVNHDVESHTLTSESTLSAFTAGAVAGVSFNTGIIAPGATGTFTVPANAPAGTVIPFFCNVHLAGMGQGTITVR